jgi:AcrR family transcriptional regulator
MSELPPIGARPRQARSVATRERFYEATLRRFASEGVEEARVQDIVADAGGSWGAYHHYFPRKHDVLLERATRELRDRVRPEAEAALANSTGDLRAAVESLFVAMGTSELPRHVHGALLREVSAHPRRLAEMLPEGELPLVGWVGLLLGEGQKRGVVSEDADPFSLAAVLTGGTMFPVIQTAYGPPLRGLEQAIQPPDPEEAIRATFRIAWRAIAA